jgi:thiol-disulfide isomerase/thioredoxin
MYQNRSNAFAGANPTSNVLSFKEKMVKYLPEIFTLKNIAILIGVIILIYVANYIYKTYMPSSSSGTVYKANLEHMTTEEANTAAAKQAEIMMFYADWCPHCKSAKPEWESFKNEYDGKKVNGYTLVFTEYNCTTETPETKDAVEKYGVEGFPTIKLIKDNQVIEYDAKPTKPILTQFVNTVL